MTGVSVVAIMMSPQLLQARLALRRLGRLAALGPLHLRVSKCLLHLCRLPPLLLERQLHFPLLHAAAVTETDRQGSMHGLARRSQQAAAANADAPDDHAVEPHALGRGAVTTGRQARRRQCCGCGWERSGTRLMGTGIVHSAHTSSFRLVHGLRPSGPPVAGRRVNVHAVLLPLRRQPCWNRRHGRTQPSGVCAAIPPAAHAAPRRLPIAARAGQIDLERGGTCGAFGIRTENCPRHSGLLRPADVRATETPAAERRR